MKVSYLKIKNIISKWVAKLKKTDEYMYYLKHHDPLTELPNRKKLIKTIEESGNNEKVIIYIDIDRFHSINDLYGRETGDEIILQLSNRLQKLFKDKSAVFREEHFYVYLEDVPYEDLEKVGCTIQEMISKHFTVGGEKIYVTASIGMSHYPSTAEEAHLLLQQAEIAMSKVKIDGKNSYGIILEEDIESIERQRKIEYDLKEVIERDELYLAYQPEIYLATGEMRAAEALLRWEHPEIGNISPVEFIPIAEETGMINKIGKWVIHEAIGQAKSWHNQGFDISLAVNVSYVQFKDGALVNDILKTLEVFDFDPSSFIIEITESLMKDLAHVDIVTKDLHKHQIRIAVDDFGTGYSSLGVLSNMYIDMIKIDRSFVKGLPTDEKSIQLVQTMIQIAENLSCTVIAEGVETVEQLDFLVENGCKYAQGYYFSRPVSSDEIIAYAKKAK